MALQSFNHSKLHNLYVGTKITYLTIKQMIILFLVCMRIVETKFY